MSTGPDKANDKGKTIVMKFGGTSVGSPEAIARVVEIVSKATANHTRVIVVVSAVAGVTNSLLEGVQRAAQGNSEFIQSVTSQLRNTHTAMAKSLITDSARQSKLIQDINTLLSEFEELCNALAVLKECSPRSNALGASLGEQMSVLILSAALQESNLPAKTVDHRKLIVTDRNYQNARPDMEATSSQVQQHLIPLLNNNSVPVVAGFIAATPSGETTILGRGGSDYSAAIIADALKVDEVIIWTDVNGIMTSNPRLIKEARTISELSYREVAELAHFGATVLHPKTIRPIMKALIPLWVRNTFNPEHRGTKVVAKRDATAKKVIKAITVVQNQRLITVGGSGMLGIPGVAAQTFRAAANVDANIILITQASSEQSICFALPSTDTLRVVAALKETFSEELANQDIDSIRATDEVVIITIVGNGIRNTPGVAGNIFTAVGNSDVNIIAIAQGSSEVSISLVVEQADILPAMHALHTLIDS